MKNNNEKKKNFFKSKLFLFAILPIFALGLVVAATFYSYAHVTVNVNQPIGVTGDLTQSVACDSGETCIGTLIRVDNTGSTERTISLREDGSGSDIDVNYVGKLVLEDKNSVDWTVKANDRKADFYYFITGEKMGYHMEAVGLESSVDYKLIYYLDSGATVSGNKPWNLNNAVEIASGTSDSSGNLVLEGSKEFTSDLPFDIDYNKNPNVGDSYCGEENGYDSYLHCNGAKIWLITGNLDLSNWNPNDWLFEEEDLVHYFDNTDGSYTIDAGSFVEFYPLFDVDMHAPNQTKEIYIYVE